MKVGVIVYGPLREFEIARKSWYIFDSLNCDYFFSTWNRSTQKNEKLGIDLNEEINEKIITQYYPNAKIKIHDECDFISSSSNIWDVNIEKMIFHWKYGLEMVKNCNIKYDILILLRSDLFIEYNKPYDNLLFLNDSRTLYGVKHITITSINKNNGNFDYFVNEVFSWGIMMW